MITLVVPTRNRAAILSRTAPSYFEQDLVDEIIVVDDAGVDDTGQVLASIVARYPAKQFSIIRNATRLGASQSRNAGVLQASNDYILFCDDDEVLEAGYAATCLHKLREHGASIVSGRRIYMRSGETTQQALTRFGTGLRATKYFRPLICEYVNGARFEGDLEVPFTNAVILTRKALLQQFPFDPYYARGNGYREETDYQMNLYTRGHKVIVTNECHSFHLPMVEVRSGGQRTGQLKQIYWSVFYTRYFFGKYYAAYATRRKLVAPRWVALAAFAVFAAYRAYVRPIIYPLALAAVSRAGAAPPPDTTVLEVDSSGR
jgi:glycosyltransferase involved in cell wall biosynthesis